MNLKLLRFKSCCSKPAQYIPTVVLLLMCVNGYSQVSFGLKVGVNLSRVMAKGDTSGAGWRTYGVSPSIHVGATGSVKLSKKFSLGADLLLSDKGYRNDGDGLFGASHLLYSNLPVYARFELVKGLSLQAGPEVGLLVAAWGEDREYLSAVYSWFDFGIIGGLEYNVTSRMRFTLRFEQGISNIIAKNATAQEYRYIQHSDPLISNKNLRDSGVVHRNQNLQLSLTYKLFGEN